MQHKLCQNPSKSSTFKNSFTLIYLFFVSGIKFAFSGVMGVFDGAGRGVVHSMYVSWIMFLVLFSGCTQRTFNNKFGVFHDKFDVTNVYDSTSESAKKINRVGIMPITTSANVGKSTLDFIYEAFNSEILKQLKFESIKISQNDLIALFGHSSFSSSDPLPKNFFEVLKDVSDVDAVLFVDITHYEPYKPVALGVKCRMVDTDSAAILWAIDELFDAGMPSVQAGISEYIAKNKYDNTFFSFDDSFVYSPLKFSYYVANKVFGKLPNNFY